MLKLLTGLGIVATVVTPAGLVATPNSQPTPTPPKVSKSKVGITYDSNDGFKKQYDIGIAVSKDLLATALYIDVTFNNSILTDEYKYLYYHIATIIDRSDGGLIKTYPEKSSQIIKNRIADQIDPAVVDSMETWSKEPSLQFLVNHSLNDYSYGDYFSKYGTNGYSNVKKFSNEISAVSLSNKPGLIEIRFTDVFKNDKGYQKAFRTEFFINTGDGAVTGSPTGVQSNNLDLTSIYK